MTPEEVRAFLSEGTRTGKLATLTAAGAPHVMPVWFVLDGDDVVFNTGAATVKGRHVLRDGRLSMCVDEERMPYSFVHIRGSATAVDNPPDALEWATRIARRYVGDERAGEYGARNAVPGELLVRLRPERVIAQADMAD